MIGSELSKLQQIQYFDNFDINCHFIREKIQQDFVKTLYLASAEQQADMLTKGLTKHRHHYLLSKIEMKNIFISPSLGMPVVKDYDNCIVT